MVKGLRQAFQDLDPDAIAAQIDRSFAPAVAAAVDRHLADGSIEVLGTGRPATRCARKAGQDAGAPTAPSSRDGSG